MHARELDEFHTLKHLKERINNQKLTVTKYRKDFSLQMQKIKAFHPYTR
jgi:hypothetical protein